MIYVGGGSLVNLLALWRAHGVDAILREAWQAGIVLAGLSAGSMCWFEHGITKSGGAPAPAPASASCRARTPSTTTASRSGGRCSSTRSASGAIAPGWGVDDGVGLLFRGTRLAEAVSSRPQARAYRVHVVDGEVVEEEIEPRLLGHRPAADPTAPLAVAELRALRAARRGRRLD